MRGADDNCYVCPHFRNDGFCVCVRSEDWRGGFYCQRCGALIGWLGRFLEALPFYPRALKHRCKP